MLGSDGSEMQHSVLQLFIQTTCIERQVLHEGHGQDCPMSPTKHIFEKAHPEGRRQIPVPYLSDDFTPLKR